MLYFCKGLRVYCQQIFKLLAVVICRNYNELGSNFFRVFDTRYVLKNLSKDCQQFVDTIVFISTADWSKHFQTLKMFLDTEGY